MKRFLCILLTLIMVLPISVAFATDDVSEIRPYGTLSGYGATWYTAGNSRTGSFYVNVTGTAWVTASTTLEINSFDSETRVRVKLYNPSNTLVYDTISWSGGYLSMADPKVVDSFSPGMVGQYRVEYEVLTFGTTAPSSGRIMCWIY